MDDKVENYSKLKWSCKRNYLQQLLTDNVFTNEVWNPNHID